MTRAVTCRYMSLHAVPWRCMPLDAIRCRHMPSHAVTYADTRLLLLQLTSLHGTYLLLQLNTLPGGYLLLQLTHGGCLLLQLTSLHDVEGGGLAWAAASPEARASVLRLMTLRGKRLAAQARSNM